MLIRNPCKKCIVRACCTIRCNDKKEQLDTIELIYLPIYQIKNLGRNILSWYKQHWFELVGLTIFLIEVFWILFLTIYL